MKKKLKIGILLNSDQKFHDGHFKIFNEILNSDFINLSNILIYKKSLKINIISSFLIKFITIFEKKYNSILRVNEKLNVKKKFKNINKIFLDKKKINFLSKNRNSEVWPKKLDLIISFEKNSFLSSKIFLEPKYGTWLINNGVKNIFFTGFWECFFGYGGSRIIIQKITKNNLKPRINIIDQGFYSTKTISWFLNKDFIFEKSSTLILKNLRLLYQKKLNKNKKYTNFKERQNPNLFELIVYILKKYPSAILRKIFTFIFNFGKNTRLTELNYNPWNLHIGNNENLKSNSLKFSNRIIPKANEAWADPFLISYKNNDYVFFENYDFQKNKGKISYGKIKDNKIMKVFDALDLNHHLSYPFLWKQKNNYFLMPESAEKKKVQIWKAKEFPKKWFPYKVLFKGESCVDTTIFDDKRGNRWLFTNKSNDKYNDHNSELFIYKTDKNFRKLVPHKFNPVIIDSRYARNAGNIYYNKKSQIIRPSQINTHNIYGKGLNLRIIKKLSLDEFFEKDHYSINSDYIKNISAIHHITQKNNRYVIDARYKKFLFYLIPKG